MNRCPHEGEILASNDVSGYRYYSCERCGGSWIPGRVLDRALSARGIQVIRTASPASASTLSCPDCQITFKSIGVEDCTLDLCHRCHGVWLDTGEAQRLSRLFPEGSEVVDADGSRAAQKCDKGAAAASVVEAVANLLFIAFK